MDGITGVPDASENHPDQLTVLRGEMQQGLDQVMAEMNANTKLIFEKLEVQTNAMCQLRNVVMTQSSQIQWVVDTVNKFVTEDAPKMAKSMFKNAMNPFGRKDKGNGDETTGD